LQVVADQEQIYPFSNRNFRYVAILDTSKEEGKEYVVLVDRASGQIVEDLAAVQGAEAEAYRAKYGRLHPALYDRLQQVGDNDVLPIAIWAAPNPEIRSREQVFAEVVGRFPQAARALERTGLPWAVEDATLATAIQETYRQLRAADTTRGLQPLAQAARALHAANGREHAVKTFGAMPSIAVSLPKRAILQLAERADVGMIYLVEEQGSPAMDAAAHTIRAPAVWQRGWTGTGVSIGILEAGNIDPVACLNIVATRPAPPGGNPGHKTWVASVAACNHLDYRGIARGASIIDAGFNESDWPGPNSQIDAAEALRWAVQDAGAADPADVVNISYRWEYSEHLNWTDRVFDYWAREENVPIVAVAGNSGYFIGSPAKGWNVITVGGSDDRGTSIWSDDRMWDGSGYDNPIFSREAEKPEIVAPAVDITTIDTNGQPTPPLDGTSLAAPQVAGIAALLIDRTDQSADVNLRLENWPTAIRAILMASAVHNIHSHSGMPQSEDGRDGAGMVDAALAEHMAANATNNTYCYQPCWWGMNTTSSFPAEGNYTTRSLYATRGERVRVAISWFSRADPPTNHPAYLPYDGLDTNYDLQVFAPGETSPHITSTRVGGSSELVEFFAPKSGRYSIRVYRVASGITEMSNRLGIAWTKDATYLPDLQNYNLSGNTWKSVIYLRNDGARPRDVRVHYSYFDATGALQQNTSDICALHPNQWCWIPVDDPNDVVNRIPENTRGFAVVEGGEDVSVTVINDDGNRAYAYEGIPSNPDRSGLGVGTEVNIPSWRNGRYGYTSRLYIQNPTPSSITTNVYFYDSNGTQVSIPDDTGTLVSQLTYTIPPSSQIAVTSRGPYYGSARVTATRPVAVTVRQDETNKALSYPGVVGRATTAFFPSLFRNYYGIYSSYQVQEISGYTASVNADYIPGGGLSFPLSGRGSLEVAMGNSSEPDGYLGWGKLTAAGGFAATANHITHINRHYTFGYSGFTGGAKDSILPFVSNAYGWGTGIALVNLGSNATNVRVKLYNGDGTPCTVQNYCETGIIETGTIFYGTLAAGSRMSLSSQIPPNFEGSASVTSIQNDDVIAVAHITWYGTSIDKGVGYRTLIR
jgi:hypothetical protein